MGQQIFKYKYTDFSSIANNLNFAKPAIMRTCTVGKPQVRFWKTHQRFWCILEVMSKQSILSTFFM